MPIERPSPFDLREPAYRYAMLNGWFVSIGDAFYNASIVLSSFAAKLGAPNTLIGLLPALLNAGSMIPQAFVAPYVARLPRKVVLYRRVAVIRVASLGLIALSAFVLGEYPKVLLAMLVLGLMINGITTGFSSLPFWETVSKTVPLERRTDLFGIRNVVGGALAFLAGFAVRALLGSNLEFPLPYAISLTLGTIGFGLGWYFFGKVDEPPDEYQPTGPISLRVPFQDFAFRRFLRVRLLFALASMAEPFYAAYAVRVLGQKGEIGLYLTLYAASSVLANLLWVRIARRYSSRTLIWIGGSLGTVAPILALLLPPGWFGLVFILQGAYLSALNLGNSTYLLNSAPAEHRSSYIGVANTLVGMAAFSPVLGGALADWKGYPLPMLLAALCYGIGWYASRRLETRA
jgi:MFS family permease